MYIPFEEIASESRVWVYQSNRPFSNDEVLNIEQNGKAFMDQWQTHGKPLKSSIKVFHHQFLVIAVDESYCQTSGCSIDSSVGFVRQIEEALKVDFFDRANIAFMSEGKVQMASLNQLKSKVGEGSITKDTLTFNNLVEDKSTFEKEWLVPSGDTWLARYF